MRKWGIWGGALMLGMGLAVALAVRGVLPDGMPDGIGPLDDIDWHGVHGIGA